MNHLCFFLELCAKIHWTEINTANSRMADEHYRCTAFICELWLSFDAQAHSREQNPTGCQGIFLLWITLVQPLALWRTLLQLTLPCTDVTYLRTHLLHEKEECHFKPLPVVWNSTADILKNPFSDYIKQLHDKQGGGWWIFLSLHVIIVRAASYLQFLRVTPFTWEQSEACTRIVSCCHVMFNKCYITLSTAALPPP